MWAGENHISIAPDRFLHLLDKQKYICIVMS